MKELLICWRSDEHDVQKSGMSLMMVKDRWKRLIDKWIIETLTDDDDDEPRDDQWKSRSEVEWVDWSHGWKYFQRIWWVESITRMSDRGHHFEEDGLTDALQVLVIWSRPNEVNWESDCRAWRASVRIWGSSESLSVKKSMIGLSSDDLK